MMEEPIQPEQEDCCNSGCNPCIFDMYEKQLQIYKKYLLNEESCENSLYCNGISETKYTEFIVVQNTHICHLHYRITFKNKSPDSNKVRWKPGDHFLYKYFKGEHACTRAYTPIKAEDNGFSIVVKKYDYGVVSSYLCELKEGDKTFWRGPYGHYNLEPKKFKRIIMIAQGTGIAPFIAIIDKILNNEEDMTKVILFYCCKCENSILFRDELYTFKSYWNFKYKIFCSTCTNNLKCKYQEPIVKHKLNIETLLSLKPFLNCDQILLCGDPKFNETYKTHLKAEVPEETNIVLF